MRLEEGQQPSWGRLTDTWRISCTPIQSVQGMDREQQNNPQYVLVGGTGQIRPDKKGHTVEACNVHQNVAKVGVKHKCVHHKMGVGEGLCAQWDGKGGVSKRLFRHCVAQQVPSALSCVRSTYCSRLAVSPAVQWGCAWGKGGRGGSVEESVG